MARLNYERERSRDKGKYPVRDKIRVEDCPRAGEEDRVIDATVHCDPLQAKLLSLSHDLLVCANGEAICNSKGREALRGLVSYREQLLDELEMRDPEERSRIIDNLLSYLSRFTPHEND